MGVVIPTSLQDCLLLLGKYKESGSVRLIAGDTGKGVIKFEDPSAVYISLTGIADLHVISCEKGLLTVGAAVTLSALIQTLTMYGEASDGKKLLKLADHVQKIANFPVRNMATWAGNLMLSYYHSDFPSDVMTIMQAAGVSLNIADSSGSKSYDVAGFLQLDMSDKVIVSMVIPYGDSNECFETYKIMSRHQNTHAFVNAGFRLALSTAGTTIAGKEISIVYGGIGPHTFEATSTQSYLVGKDLASPDTLKGALSCLSSEVKPIGQSGSGASVAYYKNLTLSLFYKFYLSVLGDGVSARVQSASGSIERPISSGVETYDSDKTKYPLTEPMTKMTATLQASGEAQYMNDMPAYPNELHGAFVLSTQANSTLVSIDTEAASKIPGVVKILSSTDVPSNGSNNWRPRDVREPHVPEPLLVPVGSTVEFSGQPFALVIAESQNAADAAARAVTAKYTSLGTPVLTIDDSIEAGMVFPDREKAAPLVWGSGDPDDAYKTSKHQISGEISCGPQYHFYMETQRCLAVPTEDGLDVVSSTQYIDHCQRAVAQMLGITENRVNVSVKRLGGGYGGKLHNAQHIACGAALAASVVKRPVRVVMDIDSNMQMVGGRASYLVKYQIGCDDNGVLNAIIMTAYADTGFSENCQYLFAFDKFFDNAYYCPHWKVYSKACKTHTASNTACRAPGALAATFIMESMMEHVAKTLNRSPEVVRFANLYKKGQVTPYGQPLPYCSLSSLWLQLMTACDFVSRLKAVETFNEANRWKKRGLSVVPLKYGIGWKGNPFHCLISIYAGDGSVSIASGSVEMGQGLNTKVAQVAAYSLGIDDLSLIKVKAASSFIGPNNKATGGSVATELVCAAVLNACDTLNARIKPVRDQMKAAATWPDIVNECYTSGVDLAAKGWVEMTSKNPFNYCSYGVTCTEVELDILTGEHEIVRSDVLYDCGESINPEIDVGQAQGAFVMGIGYWHTERFVRDSTTGQLLTKNTWNYTPPSSKDIPCDFRITFLKDAPNPSGILGSKAVGEPPMCMSCSSLFAVKHAIESARAEIGKDVYFALNGPATVDAVQLAGLLDPSQFSL
ncbi:uncharacterized protein [Oscarella lobularis]|uniref:uncharacterized protein isoform X2 n=1 Tax=Oscarella lobularis TaxID=121494 RepID=UPI0033136DDA